MKVSQLCLTLCDPMDYTDHGILQARSWSEWPFPSPGDLPNPGIEPRSPALQVDSLPTEPPRKPQNTGVSGLSLLQQIFLTQESNSGLLHCRWILHQLSCEGSFLHYPALTKVIICFGIVILLIGLPFSRCRWVLCSALVLLLQSLNSWVYSYYCCYYYFI